MKKLIFCVMALLGANLAFADYPTFENTAGLNWEYLNNGATVVMDYNNDGYDEFFYYETTSDARNFVYMRNAEGVITRSDVDVLGLPKGIHEAGLAAIDANRDGYKDLLVAGVGVGPMILDLYINTDDSNGGRKFVKDDNQTALRGVHDGAFGHFIAVADFDGDGDEDIFVTGQMFQEGSTENAEFRGIVYINDNGTFTVGQDNFAPTRGGGTCAADINNDGKVDIIYSGYSDNNGAYETHCYVNNGSAEFTEIPNTDFIADQEVSIFVSDFNNDNYNDVVILGHQKANLYLGSEDGTFTEKADAGFSANTTGADMADFNNDGYMDFVASGWHVAGEVETGIFYGNGDGTFTADAMPAELSARGGFTVAWDYDADGAMDYFVTNYSDTKSWYSALAHQVVYTRDVTNGNYGTICLPYAVVSFSGAEIYSIAGKTEGSDGIYLDQETVMEAGVPYIFKATANQIKVVYHYGEPQEATAANGLHDYIGEGTYTIPQDAGNYIVYNNALYLVNSEATIASNRAYINYGDVPSSPSAAPKINRVAMPISGAPTGMLQMNDTKQAIKAIRNGHIVILRANKEYNILGQNK